MPTAYQKLQIRVDLKTALPTSLLNVEVTSSFFARQSFNFRLETLRTSTTSWRRKKKNTCIETSNPIWRSSVSRLDPSLDHADERTCDARPHTSKDVYTRARWAIGTQKYVPARGPKMSKKWTLNANQC
jgi:hypothetical protein